MLIVPIMMRTTGGGKMRIAILAAAVLLGGCVSMTEPVQVGKDTYMIGLNARGGFSSDAELLAQTIKTATAFCASQGRDIEVQSTNVTGVQMWTPQNNQVVFICVPKASKGL
jgi:PBP1b-binding outer membrane lipoprotein LpoB